jgi:hypothetical protein
MAELCPIYGKYGNYSHFCQIEEGKLAGMNASRSNYGGLGARFSNFWGFLSGTK